MTAIATAYRARSRREAIEGVVHVVRPEVRVAGLERLVVAAAERAARVDDPRVVATRGAVAAGGVVAVATEPPRGRWLDQVVAAAGVPFPVATALTLLDGLLAALEATHRAGLAHGGIGPEVVVLTPEGGVRLDGLALGAACAAAGGAPGIGPSWTLDPALPPGAPPDGVADLYAVAAVGWWLLSGAPPGEGRPSPLPEAVVAVLRRALSPERGQRYGSSTELRSSLAAAAEAALGSRWADAGAVAVLATIPSAPPPAAFPEGATTEGNSPAPPPVSPPPGEAAPSVVAPTVGEAGPPAAPGAAPPVPWWRRRRRWAVATALALAAAVVGTVAFSFTDQAATLPVVGALPWVGNAAAGPLVVGNDVRLRVVRRGPGCVYVAEATGSLHGSGDLVYRFVHVTASSSDTVVHITGNPGFAFTTTLAYQGITTAHDSVTFVLVRPTSRQVTTRFEVRC